MKIWHEQQQYLGNSLDTALIITVTTLITTFLFTDSLYGLDEIFLHLFANFDVWLVWNSSIVENIIDGTSYQLCQLIWNLCKVMALVLVFLELHGMVPMPFTCLSCASKLGIPQHICQTMALHMSNVGKW